MPNADITRFGSRGHKIGRSSEPPAHLPMPPPPPPPLPPRMLGYDTPETGGRAKCAHERGRGAAATEALREEFRWALVSELRPTGRSCKWGASVRSSTSTVLTCLG
jgi:hypothetical protein